MLFIHKFFIDFSLDWKIVHELLGARIHKTRTVELPWSDSKSVCVWRGGGGRRELKAPFLSNSLEFSKAPAPPPPRALQVSTFKKLHREHVVSSVICQITRLNGLLVLITNRLTAKVWGTRHTKKQSTRWDLPHLGTGRDFEGRPGEDLYNYRRYCYRFTHIHKYERIVFKH